MIKQCQWQANGIYSWQHSVYCMGRPMVSILVVLLTQTQQCFQEDYVTVGHQTLIFPILFLLTKLDVFGHKSEQVMPHCRFQAFFFPGDEH